MIQLKAEKRLEFGKKLKTLRDAGGLPVVVYGPGETTEHLSVNFRDFEKVWDVAGETGVIKLEIGDKSRDVLIQSVDVDVVKDTPTHVDFYVVSQNKPIEISIPLEFIGVSPVLKLGGTVVKVLHELDVEALPKDIPSEISVDMALLVDLESQITAGELPLPAGVSLVTDKDEVVAAVSVASAEEEAPVSTEIDMSSIKVEAKGKKEEEEGGSES